MKNMKGMKRAGGRERGNRMVEVYFDDANNVDYDEDAEKLSDKLTGLIDRAVEKISPDFPAYVTVTVTDNAGIREINKEQRGFDKPTDVLSFPLLFWAKPEVLENELSDADYNMESGLVHLGDIVISKEKAEEQGDEYGHGFDREISYLAVHGLLHLFGYDHTRVADKKIMREKEEFLLL
jgi:probable rRNA maturation factor